MRTPGRGSVLLVAVGLVLVATLVVVTGVRSGRTGGADGPERRPGRAAGHARGTTVVDGGPVAASRRPVPFGSVMPLSTASPPRTVEIPAIGVHSDLEALHLDAAGALEAPRSFARAGWYADGPQPGRPGPAVIAGHVDSRSGPAVFSGLDRLRPGDAVTVHRADGSTAEFVVTGTRRYPKSGFPSDAVYAPTPDPELRLITCSGAFDRSSGHYVDNTVVSATLRAR